MTALAQHQEALKSVLIVGLGISGYSVFRYLSKQPVRLTVADTREIPPYLSLLKETAPDVNVITGRIPLENLHEFDEIVVSPGISLPASENASKVVGDVELFAQAVQAPVIGITGSNGKSTVTTLVRDMLQAAGLKAVAGGNLGTPALDLLAEERPDFYVLELSSFQLETVHSLNLAAAAILNISEDHLDRHEDIEAYAQAKLRIFKHADQAVINCDDQRLKQAVTGPVDPVGFALQEPDQQCEFGIVRDGDKRILFHGKAPLIEEDRLSIQGDSQVLNVLAALALVKAAGIKLDARVIQAAAKFKGLPHRCQLIADYRGVKWINDSKATNPGAAKQAILNFSQPVILIAGGQSKGADFNDLASVIDRKAKHVILLGEDAAMIEGMLAKTTERSLARSMEEAVEIANRLAEAGEVVLLSPACASYDMFENYAERGQAFSDCVSRRVKP